MTDSDLKIWDKVADRWDSRVATDGTLRTLLFENSLLETIGQVKGKKILDAGCGNGYITDMLAEEGAEVIGVDGSGKMVERAKNRYPHHNFLQADLLKPLEFETQSFDVVVANMVLMHLADIDTFLGEAARILRLTGCFVASVLHPCFNEPAMGLSRSVWSKLIGGKIMGVAADYFRKSGNRRYESALSETVTHYHRTLQEYSEAFWEHGMAIAVMKEPHDLPDDFLLEHPKLEYATRLPRFIIFKTIKRTV